MTFQLCSAPNVHGQTADTQVLYKEMYIVGNQINPELHCTC